MNGQENQLDSLKAKLAEKETVFILFFIEIERLYSINEKYEREVAQLRQKDDEHVSKYNDIINKLNVNFEIFESENVGL